MATSDRNPDRDGANPNLIAGLVIGICLVIGVIVWAGGWGFSNSDVRSPNPAPQAQATHPPAQMPVRETTGAR
jgi:hypothetical protein